MKVDSKKLPKSQIELTFELTVEEFLQHFNHAVSRLKGSVKVDGFRPGQAPNKMVEEKLKPEALLMEAGDHAVQHTYSDYVKENKIEAVGHPEVKIQKIAKGSPFIFTAVVTVLPEVKLPYYKKIAAAVKGQDVEVTEEEVQDSLKHLQKSRAKMSVKNDVAAKGDFVQIEYSSEDVNGGQAVKDQFILGEAGFMKGFEDNIIGMKDGQEKEFKATFPETVPQKELAGKEADFKVKMISVQKLELPEINDEFVKQMGAFDSLTALKKSMKEGMTVEKKENEKQRKRAEILEKIAEKSEFETPEELVKYEQERLLADLKNRVSQAAKISFEEYLASVKQTEEQIKETYKKEAEKRLRGFLVLKQLGKEENVEIADKEVEEEVAKSTKNYSKEQMAKIDTNELKEYTKGVLFNEKVFQTLEIKN